MADETVVSHYRIVQKLRSGGMGDVYLAEDERLPRAVALKLLPAERSGDQMLQQRLMREARAASALSHPNIAQIFEAGEDQGRVFIAMEYIDGESLADRIARAPLKIDDVIRIALQIVDAVCDAHAAGVIHRDLKPGNVMLTSRSDVKVLDFGLAKFNDAELMASDTTAFKTESGVVMGTPAYMSPEQAMGGAVDQRSDIFSIGVLLYELVTNRVPFGSAADTRARIIHDQPEAMARFNWESPPELDRIVRKCLEKSPERRYQSASELLVDLRNLERDHRAPKRIAIPPLNRVRTALWAALFLIIAVAIGITWKPSAVRSIAVLPFAIRGGAADSDLGEGLADLVINDLSRHAGVKVMARSTSFRYKDADSPAAAGSALNVDAVLTGRVDATTDPMVVSTELVDVRDGSRLGGEQFQHARADLATLAADIGAEVARTLRLDGGAPVKASLAASTATPRIDGEAYRLYLRGRQQWNLRTADGLRQALDLFRQTVEIEPRFAPAYAGLADTYTLLERYAKVPNAESRARAIAAAEHAVQLDPSLPEAHASLASVRETYTWDWKGAEEEYRTAIRLSPSYATAHQWHALLLTRLGRFDEAREEIRIARELDPLSPAIATALANIDYYRGDYARSAAEARDALKLKPDFGIARVQLALSLAMSGDHDGALRELEPIRKVSPDAAAVDAIVRARGGDAGAARAFLASAEARPDAAANGYGLAAVHAAMGDRAGALRWLNIATEAHSIWMGYAAVDPAFASLHGDPEFTQLLGKIGLAPHAG